ncbi:hypothetical protein M9H77_21506 [Catharanthus roseus]|uniref:Uncharacterized protein n=1 Tax=Catharanthus roseus TaxID=4058 RepID=A0ACC0ARW1_CATRO|nr:hypothetical protein M9H77_21506 [Catharanthus roseus]
MGGGNRTVDPVKVVIINTQYVETDAMSFKSVVQRLTGKDSKIEVDDVESSTPEKPRFYNNNNNNSSGVVVSPAVMARGLSFKDFDKLLKELPPLEELYRFYADN